MSNPYLTRHNKMLAFIKKLAAECSEYENENEIAWAARALLEEIGLDND